MARYFFDLVDGVKLDRDDVGLEFYRLSDVRAAAADALADIVRELLPDGPRRHLVIQVRDANGSYIHECRFDFSAQDTQDASEHSVNGHRHAGSKARI
jgi:hypothetical protein